MDMRWAPVCLNWVAPAGASAVRVQVVLPMLLNDLVKKDDQGNELPNTWVTEQQFYAGLGAVQVRGCYHGIGTGN